MSDKIYRVTSKHIESIKLLQNWYNEQQYDSGPSSSDHNSIKISWLSGMMKKTHYDEHERNMLNKMVNKYNEKLV